MKRRKIRKMEDNCSLMDIAKEAYRAYRRATPEQRASIKDWIKRENLETLKDVAGVLTAPLELIAATAYVGANVLYDQIRR